jgi:hypothetical protein
MLIVTTYHSGSANKPTRAVAQFVDRGGERWTRVRVEVPWDFGIRVSGQNNHERARDLLLKHPLVAAAMLKERMLDQEVALVDQTLGPNAKYYWAIFDANFVCQRAPTVSTITGVMYP